MEKCGWGTHAQVRVWADDERLTDGALAVRVQVGEHGGTSMAGAQQPCANQTLALRSAHDFHLRKGGKVVLQLFLRVR